jgi:RNA polymerase sigma-70 factor (ECF subfamily)
LENHWLEPVYLQNRLRFFRMAWLIVRDTSLAEDVVHDAMLRLSKLRKQPNNPAAYGLRTIRNLSIDARRKRNRERNEVVIEVACQDASAESHAVLLETLASLNPDEREVIELKLRMEFTFREIAELLEQPLSTVSSRYQRAINRLQVESEA